MTASTTVRVSAKTRDALKALSARRGASSGEVIAELVEAADDDLLLADAERAFERLASNRDLLAAYRSESREMEGAFEAPIPEW